MAASDESISAPPTSGMDWQRSRMIMKPDNQMTLSEAELEEEIPRCLQAQDPLAFKNVVHFSQNAGDWLPAPPALTSIVFVHFESYAVHKESPEVHDPLANFDQHGSKTDIQSISNLSTIMEEEEENEEDDEEEILRESESGEMEENEGEETEISDKAGSVDKEFKHIRKVKQAKKIPNAFNFYDGASQTPDFMERNQESQTEPAGRGVLHQDVSASIIYDAYAIDFDIQQKEREKKAIALPQPGRKVKIIKKHETQETNKMLQVLNMMDRVVCQNVFDQVTFDFRYYEDPGDEFREENSGTLLPLWRFTHSSVRSATVTDIQWNPNYYDLFAVSFGAYEYSSHPTAGALALFTLKNPTYPEWLMVNDIAILCLTIHSEQNNLIAVGNHDGSLAVYNTAQEVKPGVNNALYLTYSGDQNAPNHSGPVVQVKWADDPSDVLNLFSISKDGKVTNWKLTPNGLVATTIHQLALPTTVIRGPEGAILDILARGFSFSFHPNSTNVYHLGTEDGRVSKCSISHDRDSLYTIEAHNMAVSRIAYNHFDSSIYITSSFDWTVRIWSEGQQEPLFVFNLGNPVGDAEWAPYSSTVFAGITTDGICHVFDLNLNKYRPICVQQVTSRIGNNHATRLRFNRETPIIVIGDERGTLVSLKLSPNLRVPPKVSKKEPFEPRELELRKLIKLVSLTKPAQLEQPPDKPCLA